MKQSEVLSLVDSMIEESRTAILTTVDSKGRPHNRWMTPTLLRERPGAIYAVTSPKFAKYTQIENNGRAQWMFQRKSLIEIINVDGEIWAIRDPSLKSEVIQAIGPYLRVFWNLNLDERELVVLETVIEEATYFKPMKGLKEKVFFQPEKDT